VGAWRLVEQRATREHADREDAHPLVGTVGDDVPVVRLVETGGHHAAGARVEQVVRHLNGVELAGLNDLAHRARLAGPGQADELHQARRLCLAEGRQHALGSEHVGRGDGERIVVAAGRQAVVQLQQSDVG
jgi:hypothetical protein